MENKDVFITEADINDEKKEKENEVSEQKDINQTEENKEENVNETTNNKEINPNIENENENENDTTKKIIPNSEVQNENENEKINENQNNNEIENENETEKKETNLEIENENKNETSEIKEMNNEVENENKNESPEKKEANIEIENENEKKENNKESQNEEEKKNETENNKENEDENPKIDSIKNKGSPFITEALDDVNEEIKEEINEEENTNKKKEEEKEKVGQYYFPMIINRYRKENYNSAGYLFKHPERPIDTSKKINFKTNPGLCRGPVKFNFKPKRDITPVNDLMNYLQEMFHIPPSSRSVSIPYDNFRERMKLQFLSRNTHVFGNFKFPPKNIVYHSIDSNYREDKIIKARNIAMVKLPKIKQGYNYSSQDYVHKNDVKNYSISKPF